MPGTVEPIPDDLLPCSDHPGRGNDGRRRVAGPRPTSTRQASGPVDAPHRSAARRHCSIRRGVVCGTSNSASSRVTAMFDRSGSKGPSTSPRRRTEPPHSGSPLLSVAQNDAALPESPYGRSPCHSSLCNLGVRSRSEAAACHASCMQASLGAPSGCWTVAARGQQPGRTSRPAGDLHRGAGRSRQPIVVRGPTRVRSGHEGDAR
jgi:hypothetical protein